MLIRQSQRATDRESRGKKGKKLQVSKGWRRRGKKKQEGGIGGTDEQVRSLAQGGVRKVFGWMGEEEEEEEEGNMLFSICWKLVCSTCSAGKC